jgi:hypothetical protein
LQTNPAGFELLVAFPSMCPGVSGLNLTGLLMQACGAAVGLGLLAMDPGKLRICCRLGFLLGLALVLERSRRTVQRSLFTCDRSIVEGAVAHRRNIALAGRWLTLLVGIKHG